MLPMVMQVQQASHSRRLLPSDRGFSRSNCPWYDTVPKDPVANLAYREELIQAVDGDKKAEREIWCACRREPLFYLNAFGWTYDPRLPEGQKKLPFITFDIQDEALYEIFRALGYYDILIEKSRDEGASWICLEAFLHQWHFQREMNLGMTSRKADLVDSSGNPDCLFWKLQYQLANEPDFLCPNYTHREMLLKNTEQKSTIVGESATGEVGRAGRTWAYFMDEFAAFDREDGYRALAATGDNTESRVFNSTPRGTGNAFYDVRQNPAVKKVQLPWYEDPRKNGGLYRGNPKTGEVEIQVRTPNGRRLPLYRYMPDYQFITDDKVRSPWYDYQCARRAHPMLIAQELDMDYQSSTFTFFDESVLNTIIDTQTRPAVMSCDFVIDPETKEIIRMYETDSQKGPWHFWISIDPETHLPPMNRRYAMGVDISAGTGASNSCMSIVDIDTGEKVGEYANPNITPERLAIPAYVIAHLFREAYLIWENNGPGRPFGKRLLELGYVNFYHRRDDVSIKRKVSDIAGWASTKETKYQLLSDYRDAQYDGSFTNPSRVAVAECREYIHLADGSVDHADAVSSLDPTGAKHSHGDRVMADALAWKACKDMRGANFDENDVFSRPAETIPDNSVAGRRLRRMQQQEDELNYVYD
jgi:hypothetical protein